MPCRFKPAAVADLSAIWTYSARRWGRPQADNYTRLIVGALEEMAAQGGPDQDATVSGFKRRLIGSHIAFYRRETADSIVVVRLLHQSMDIIRHLPEEI